jgi:hippurate hydrolase
LPKDHVVTHYTTTPLQDQMTAWRHDFHRHPELGFDETRTAARVGDLLESWGIEVHRGIGRTGVVGVLRRGTGPASIGLRADMDALPITEANSFDYISQNKGVMHACGHDGHTSMLLGAAQHLAQHGAFDGTVVFIFQPNEEHGQGAPAMIADGLFDRFPVDQVFAIHNMPGMETGHIAMRVGPMTAAESLFEITINARGGHAALPHMGVDAIVVGAQIVNALQTIVSRKLNPGLNGVVSVTEFITDGSRNVLPGTATLKGDARALTPDTNKTIEMRMRQIVAGICAAHDVTAEVSYNTIFPPTINSADAVRMAATAGRAVFGDDHVDDTCAPKLFSEDFAHMASAGQGCFLLLGNGTTGAHARTLHSADYDFNDAALAAGSSFWVTLVEQTLVTA